jgi:hypothetical protein
MASMVHPGTPLGNDQLRGYQTLQAAVSYQLAAAILVGPEIIHRATSASSRRTAARASLK